MNTAHTYETAGGGLFVTTGHVFAGPKRRYLDGTGVLPDYRVGLDRDLLAAGRDSQIDAALSILAAEHGERVSD